MPDWRYQGSGLQRFLHWWRDQLLTFLPERVANTLSLQGQSIYVEPGDAGALRLRLGLVEGAPTELLPADDPVLAQKALQQMRQRSPAEHPPLKLLLPSDEALIKELQLPLAARENLDNVLRYEMDSHTPFSAEQVHFDKRVLWRSNDDGQMGVLLVVVPRRVVERELQAVETLELKIDGIDVRQADGVAGVNLLPREQRHNTLPKRALINASLALASVLLLALLAWQSLNLQSARLQNLEAQVDRASEQAMAVRALRTELSDAINGANFLVRKKVSGPTAVAVINELSQALPDHTYVSGVRIDGNSVRLEGYSAAASDLIGVIAALEMFAEPSFAQPVQQDRRVGKERFTIEAQIVERGPDATTAG